MNQFTDLHHLLETLRPILRKGKINKFYIRRPKNNPLEIKIRFKLHLNNFHNIQGEIMSLHRPNIDISIDLQNEFVTIIFRREPSTDILHKS
jgi:hypothetical protein